MNTPAATALSSTKAIHLSFDVGHSSIGWAAISADASIRGCGVVTFPNDDCLASARRTFRRQRRHVRATRQRISRIARLLVYQQVLTQETVTKKHAPGGGHSAPWILAARVLKGGALLTWEEMWDVIRWYAHNRGYDGNRFWSTKGSDAEQEDIEKVQNAQALYARFGTRTMAETFCAICNLDPLGTTISCNLSGTERPKGRNAAFPRADVRSEVSRILELHCGTLPHLDGKLIAALMDDWKALPCPETRLPARYQGGLLFGQLIPRLENRIIATCSITYEQVYRAVVSDTGDEAKARREAQKKSKVPQKDCLEFYRFRWAMQVANIQISSGTDRQTRRLSVKERNLLNERMNEKGFLTPGELKKAVKEITGGAPNNLEQLLTHPDADQALILDPAKKLIENRSAWKTVFLILPESLRKRAIGQLRRGKTIRLGDLLARLSTHPPELEAALDEVLNSRKVRGGRKKPAVTREDLLNESIQMAAPTGRAPFSRLVLNEAVFHVFNTDRHPAEEGGPLFRSEAIRASQRDRAIDRQTNNHLLRHRLLILSRLHADLLREFAEGDPSRVKKVVVEVNRNLPELSGRTAKQIKQELGQQLANFKKVSARLEKAFEGKGIRITSGLIRKARIAEDLGWECPYTGKAFDEFDLLYGRVDKDHIIPRSERPSDSLDSMVITFSEVNRMKGKRTAYRFIEACQGQTVEGRPELSIKTLANFEKDVVALEAFKGHADDKRRKKRRKEFMLLPDYVEKEFTPRDLTQTSHLVRLAAQLLERPYAAETEKPAILSLSGSLTGAVRKQWQLLGCLAAANRQVIDPQTEEILTKTEIREITHLHHALDAAILGLAATLFPPGDRHALELLVKRRLNAEERTYLKRQFGNRISFTQEGEPRLIDLPTSMKNQLRDRLAERRVVQHVPAELSGLRVEQNAWRVLSVKDGEATLQQTVRQPDGTRSKKAPTKEKMGKLLGLFPEGGHGKLKRNKSVLVIPENFGLALDPEPRVLPFHKIPVQLRELRRRNGGKPVRILRNGMLIEVKSGNYKGVWKIFSIKNNTAGIALDIGFPDVVRLRNNTEGHRINVLVSTLLKNGVAVRKPALTGSVPELSA